MSNGQIACAAIAAALLFWIVGAYNRLVRLRGAIVQTFAPVAAEFRERDGLLAQQHDALLPLLDAAAAERLEALRAARAQLEAACGHAQQRPGAPGAITSLRLADEIMVESRAKLPLPPHPDDAQAELGARLVACDATLALARRQFNAAVAAYNRALRQFPTLLLVRLFGFRAAGLL